MASLFPNEVCVDCVPGQSADAHQHHNAATQEAVGNPVASTSAIAPPTVPTPHVIIEYCDRCRWSPRATWMQTELGLTFPPPHLQAITLIPHNTPETGGLFRIWLDRGSGHELIWDRKSEGGFPELKILKQRVRNLVQPEMSLGHSDKK